MEPETKVNLPRRIKGKHLSTFRDYRIDTNYISVRISQPIEEIYIYKVVFTPKLPADNIRERLNLLQKGLPEIRSFIPSPVLSGSNIYSLKPPSQTQRDIQVDKYTISIKQVKLIPAKANPHSLLMFLNNGLRNLFRKLGYTQIGKTGKFFEVKNSRNLDADLKMFSGFKANFMQLEKGIYLRVDSAKKIVRNQTVLDYINDLYSKNKNKQRDQKRTILKTELINQIVMTNYGKTRYVKIIDVIFENVDELKLNGKDQTLRQFYQEKYQKKIQNPKQPLIEVQSKMNKIGDRCVLVPEMCLMTGIPDDFDQFKRKKVSEATILSPFDKKKEIEYFLKLNENANDLSSLKQLGIEVDKKLNQITAKLIQSPKLQLGQNRSVENGKQANFQLFRDLIFDNKLPIMCGIFTTRNADTSQMTDTFRSTSKNLGVKFDFELMIINEHDKYKIINAYFSEINKAIQRYNINMALIVIPGHLKQSYGEIKTECLKNLNIVSQCIVDNTLRKKNLQSVATKVLLQMIAKRGNTLWVPKMTGRLYETMIMAFDNAKGKSGNSIACCATLNDTFSSYYSSTSKFTNNQDKFQEMVKLSFDAINYYSKKNSKTPKEVIIFHNSSSADQVSLFRTFFIDSLTEKLSSSFSSGMTSIPNFSLVMVNTKTSERFFVNDNNNGARNVQAGTIVADEIVSENFDFYLVSQGSNRGSTVPNHYKVVFSNSKIEEGILHELVFSQCFNYVNWTGSIKIPGVLQYAKKCAKFAAEALEGQRVKEDLNCKLYYV